MLPIIRMRESEMTNRHVLPAAFQPVRFQMMTALTSRTGNAISWRIAMPSRYVTVPIFASSVLIKDNKMRSRVEGKIEKYSR